jgi:penicillin-insensitive murein endopeptidase
MTFKMKKSIKIILLTLILLLIILSIPEIIHTNKGISTSVGRYSKGSVKNSYLTPFKGNNFRYFSLSSYYLMNNAYVHQKVYQTLIDSYKMCESRTPKTFYHHMECSDKKGGQLMLHRTHQNGLSIDFMVPKKRKGKMNSFWDKIGLFHYLLDFNDDGILKIDHKTQIDFNAMGKHLVAVDEAARKNGLRIRKVILKVELIDDIFASESGQILKGRDIYFVRRLNNFINRVHDDHYHVDFEILR